MLKILVLDCNVRYISPPRNSLSLLFSLLGDTTFFGPGYVDNEVLREGLDSFRKKNGPFDVTIFTEHSTGPYDNGYSITKNFRFLVNNFYFNFNYEDYNFFINSLINSNHDKSLRIITLCQIDPWAVNKERLNFWGSNSELICTIGNQFVKKIHTQNICKENLIYFENYNMYVDFVCNNRNKIFPYLHYIHDTEIKIDLSFKQRKQISIPGTLGRLYSDRVHIRKQLLKEKITISDNRNFIYKLIRFGSRFVPSYGLGNPMTFSWYNLSYLRSISSAKMAYTSGTDFNIFIRKYLEIPSQSTVLLCKPPLGMSDAGFTSGVDYIDCTLVNTIDVIKSLSNDINSLRSIANSAHNVLLRSHTLWVRAQQLKFAIEKAVNKQYNGAYWENGEVKHYI